LKIAFTPTLFRERVYAPEIKPPDTTPAEIKAPDPVEEISNLFHVADDLAEYAAEIIFRETYEATSEKFGISFTVEELAEKKQFFEEELDKQKSTLAKPLRATFNKVIDNQFEIAFRHDQLIIERGGKDGLILKAKLQIENQINGIQEYLTSMKKTEKGWVYNSFSADQLEERKYLDNKILELRKTASDDEYCLNQSLLALGARKNPVGHLHPGSLEDLMKRDKRI